MNNYKFVRASLIMAALINSTAALAMPPVPNAAFSRKTFPPELRPPAAVAAQINSQPSPETQHDTARATSLRQFFLRNERLTPDSFVRVFALRKMSPELTEASAPVSRNEDLFSDAPEWRNFTFSQDFLNPNVGLLRVAPPGFESMVRTESWTRIIIQFEGDGCIASAPIERLFSKFAYAPPVQSVHDYQTRARPSFKGRAALTWTLSLDRSEEGCLNRIFINGNY